MKHIKKLFCLLLSAVLLSIVMVSAAGEEASLETAPADPPTVAAEAAGPIQQTEIYDYDRDVAYAKLAEWQDPDYMSDEDFFGKYDNGQWTNFGTLDYERIAELAPVKAAVQQQNYELAKEEWLQYFRDKRMRIPSEKPEFTRQAMLSSQMLEYDLNWNTNSNITPLDIITVPSEPGEVILNMEPTLKNLREANEKLTVYLIGLKKDGSVAKFDSRNKEGGQPPKLEVTIDGVTTSIVATDDTYVSPCENHNKIYGMEDTFLVEESVSSIGVGKDAKGKTINVPADKNTKRGLIQFDMSGFSADANLSNAVIRLYGENIGQKGNTGDMQVAAFSISNYGWPEAEQTYYGPNGTGLDHLIFSWYGDGAIGYLPTRTIYPIQDPVSGKAICGHRFPEEIARFARWWSYPVEGYLSAAEDNEHYAFIAIKQLVHLLDERGDEPGFDLQQWLDVSCRSEAMSKGLFNLCTSEHMNTEIWTAITKYMWQMGNYLTGATPTGRNGTTYIISGFNHLNVYFYEFRQHYEWAEMIRHYSDVNVTASVKADGSGIEGGLGYVANVYKGQAGWVQINENMGVTEEASMPISPELKNTIATGLRYVMHMTGPGYVDNQMGDGGNHRTDYKSQFLLGGRQLADDESLIDDYLLYAGTDGAEGIQDPTRSVMYPIDKRMVMRTGWGENDLYLMNSFNENVTHCHRDDGNIIMFAYGNYLLIDPLYYTYTSGDPYGTRLKSSFMHNTVNMNGKDQTAPAEGVDRGYVNLWGSNSAFDISSMGTQNVQDAQTFDRAVVFIKPGYYIVSDYLVPKNNNVNTYSQDWHFMPTANIETDAVTGQLYTNFEGEANLIIAQDSMENKTVTVKTDGLYSEGNSHLVQNVKYAVYEQETAGPAVYNTVLYPVRAGEDAAVETTPLAVSDVQDKGASAMEIRIDNPDQSAKSQAQYYMVHDFGQQKLRNYGDYRTDALFNYVEQNGNGNKTRILMQGGTQIRQRMEGGYSVLLKSLQEVQDLGIEFSSTTMAVSTSQKDFNIQNITVRVDRKIDVVTLNGETIPFKQAGAYLYFGDKPIEEGGETVTPTPQPTVNPPVHGGGGGGGGASIASTPVSSPTSSADNTPAPQGKSQYFEDVTNQAPWAAEAIDYLVEAGIVNGVSPQNFAPEQQVSREEAVKMLVLAKGLQPIEQAELPFTDVPAGHWARPYIAAAYEAGIVQGISPTIFDLGQNVSRQDLAVLCDRTLYVGENSEGTDIVFMDEAIIAPYALESVKKLGGAGVIDSGGAFRPEEPATRAECAKILYRLIK